MTGEVADGRSPVPREFARLLPWHRGTVPGAVADVWAPRMGLLITGSVLAGYALMTLINVIGGLWRFPPGRAAVGAVLFGGVCVLQLVHSDPRPRRWPAYRRALTLSAQTLATYLPFPWFGPAWSSLGGFLAGSMLLMVSGRVRWALYGAVGVTFPLLILGQDGMPATAAAQLAGVTLQTGLVIYGIGSLPGLVTEACRARVTVARMAVVQERLRVARDLHDLLGYHLSAMTLKSELAYRLLPRFADRAREELAEILAIARRALADVRVVASGYRDMSLADEARTVVSILSSAGIEVVPRISGALPAKAVDSVMAIVLREAVTNVLRHSKAQTCVLELGVTGGTVRLRVANDGAEAAPEGGAGGSGLANLTARLRDIGGGLTVSRDGEWFELVAEAPAEPARRAGRGAEEGGDETGLDLHQAFWPLRRSGATAPRTEPSAQRVAMLFTLAVIGGYAVLTAVNVLNLRPGGWALLGFAVCLLVALAVQFAHSVYQPRSWPSWLRAVTLAVLALATGLPFLWLGTVWGSMAGFLAGSVLLVVVGWWRWALYAGVGAAVLLAAVASGNPPVLTGYLTISSLLTGLVVFGVSSLSALVAQIYEARGKLARMAAEQERLRVARDLNDLLGRNLSEMTMKSELAYRLLPDQADRTRQQVEEVLWLARRTLAEVRATATGYREMSLVAEARIAVTTLASAGTETELDLPGEPLPREVDAALALALRETVAELLRRGPVRRCAIGVSTADGAAGRTVRLQVTGEGCRPAHRHGEDGPEGLREYLQGIGGRLTTAVRDGRFQTTVEIPAALPEGGPVAF